jgi:hypothetical protein
MLQTLLESQTPTVIADKNLSPRLEPFEEAFEQGWFILQLLIKF